MPLLHFIWSNLEQSSLDTMNKKLLEEQQQGATIYPEVLSPNQGNHISAVQAKHLPCHNSFLSGYLILNKDCMLLYFTIPKILQCIVATLRVYCKLSCQQPDLHVVNHKKQSVSTPKDLLITFLQENTGFSSKKKEKKRLVHQIRMCILFWYMNSCRKHR